MAKTKELKSKVRKDGEFIPPDGGWGWMIVVAAGLSNLSALPIFQQFGLIFRDKFERLGISSSKTTTIINVHSAMNSCVGLINGPMFKTFTYRQVSFAGASLVFISLMLTTFSYNFASYLISFSLLYGCAYGISSSANALALNTYWKERRRLATGLSWTATGIGPMLWPHVITALFDIFGENGAILILGGFSLHAVACALLLQPVEWHAKEPTKDSDAQKLLKSQEKDATEKKLESGYFSQMSKFKNLSAFSSQYLYNEDDPINTGYEITDPGIPMMIRANDGYFSQSRQSKSRVSSREESTKTSRLNSKKPSMTNLLENRSRKSSTLYLNESKKNSAVNLGALAQERETYKPKRKTSVTLKAQIPESEIEDCPTLKAPQDLKAEEKAVVEKIDPTEAKHIADKAEKQMAGSKSLKSLKMDGQYSEKYNKDNHSNVSLKNQQYSDKYNKDNHSNVSLKNQQYNEKYTKDNHSNVSLKNQDDLEEKKYLKDNHSNQSIRTRQRRKSNNFNYESEVLKQASLKLEEYLKEKEEDHNEKIKLLMDKMKDNDDDDDDDNVFAENKANEKEEEDVNLTFWQKVTLFFDLDLLKDFTFINLMLGVTLAGFSELNFSLLTPFILGDFGKTKSEVASFMSLLAGVDISIRFCVPFIAGKIGWENNSFFLFGVLTMAFGRVVLAYSQAPWVLTVLAVVIGFGKGLRTVFMALVIPTHVPLHKLPGASGIQLVTAGVLYLALGPVVGWIKDHTSTAVTLHCLNIFTFLTAISWGTEKLIRSRTKKNSEEDLVKA